ncbi:hypothetical protein [Mariniphaga anaerophila]|nr:hypothetical protein [Mariniphaga anaerophila]
MKNTALIIIVFIWVFSLLLLIIALTNVIPGNPLQEYKLIVGIGFILITSGLKFAYNKAKNKHR